MLVLQIISVIFSGYCTVSHTPPCITAGRLKVQWTIPTPSLCWYKNKGKSFSFLSYVLNFLTRNLFFNYFLTVRTPMCFLTLTFHSKKDNALFPHWFGYHCLALSLIRYRADGKRYGVWQRQRVKLLHLRALRKANTRLHRVWHP
jgi:hypothetical protein